MRTVFKTLKFKRRNESSAHLGDIDIEMYVPGVNSGVYSPASLHISVCITKYFSGLFRLKKTRVCESFTLTQSEFDQLREEIQKIDLLREK